MTREKAIGHIKDVICENNTIKPNIVVFEQEKEALYMAIKALEQERSRLAQITQYRNDCEKLMQENEQLKKALEQEPILDKIKDEILNDWQIKKFPSSPFSCGLRYAVEIIDKYRGESDCRECKVEHDCYECEKYTESEERNNVRNKNKER